jgi:hypothetical protein
MAFSVLLETIKNTLLVAKNIFLQTALLNTWKCFLHNHLISFWFGFLKLFLKFLVVGFAVTCSKYIDQVFLSCSIISDCKHKC